MARSFTAPIMSYKSVRELLNIIQDNNASTTKDFMAVIEQVRSMEKQLEAAVNELASMRQQLAEAQEKSHPARNTMQKTIISMQAQVLEMRDKLTELKENIINGCKNAIAAFKEKGTSALDGIARFFKIKPVLESIRDSLDMSIKDDDRLIAKIEAISTEYHLAGLHVKNMGRAITGKDAVQDAKPSGKLAAAISYPFRKERQCFASMKKSAEAALGSVARLEEKAAEKKPPIKETIDKINKKIELEKAERPAPGRNRNIEHDR